MRNYLLLSLSLVVLSLSVSCLSPVSAATCPPTPWDEIGPFYRPNAPVRNSIGKGYVLSGTVRATNCKPIPGAQVQFWQTGPSGQYEEAYRATVVADKQGRYRLETSFPPGYAQRPPHIHILVDVKGYQGLVTQHYPKRGKKSATLDLVLEVEKDDAGQGKDRGEEIIRPGKKPQ